MLRLGIQLAKVNLTTRTGRRRVFFQPSKYLFALAITSVFGLAPLRMVAQEPAPAPAAAQGPQWKNQAEFDLYTAISKETDPKAKLQKLQQWEKEFPDSAFAKQRRTLLMGTYYQLGQAQQAFDTAKQILADDPNDFGALYIVVTLVQAVAGQTPAPAVLDQGQKAATALINVNDAPATMTPQQWATQKPQVQNLAHTTLAWIALQKKDWPTAEGEYQKVLQADPNNGAVDYQLATAIYSEKNPAKTPTALFYYARAASYEGQGALNPAGRQQVMTFVQKAYKGYHGSDEGFNNLLAAAKASPAPPADFTIKNALDIAKAEMANEEEWNKAHPQEALWKGIKDALTGADGANYFNSGMKDSKVQLLKGKVVKLEPATRPKTILLAVEDGKSDGTTADATLKFEMALPGSVELGTELTFEGVPESYTASPFMVVFNVEKEDLHGWTGKNAPAGRGRGGATKKSASK
jgi:tetratricopeptide (TPR) repeat protein